MKELGYQEVKGFVCGQICNSLNPEDSGFHELACSFSPDVNLSVIEGKTYTLSKEAEEALAKYWDILNKGVIPQGAFYGAFGVKVLDFESVRSFVGKRLAEGYDYDEVLQFSILAAELALCPENSENYECGEQFTLSEKASLAAKNFFSLCEGGKNKYEAFVEAFYK